MIKLFKQRIDGNLIKRLVKEGERVGKAPWCCCLYHEQLAYNILNNAHAKQFELETFQETEDRRKKEFRKLKCKSWDEWRERGHTL